MFVIDETDEMVMREDPLHAWDVTTAEAIAIQQDLRNQVVRQNALGEVRLVAGVDVGGDRAAGIAHAAVVVLSYPELEILETAQASLPLQFPYVPGLLSFREVPVILGALRKLAQLPDLILCDGQGLAHPRRFGLACHLGVWCDLPCIGVAKSRLLGEYQPLGEQRGEWQPLLDAGEVIGAVLRTRAHAKPLFISTGHRVDLSTAISYVLRCAPKYRLPETTRQAHRLASQMGGALK